MYRFNMSGKLHRPDADLAASYSRPISSVDHLLACSLCAQSPCLQGDRMATSQQQYSIVSGV